MNEGTRKHLLIIGLALVTSVSRLGAATPAWPQFLGPNGSRVAPGQNPVISFGTTSNVLWQTALPSGASSPCIWGDRIFLTAFENDQLKTLCVRRQDGRVLWKQRAPAGKLERFQPQEGSPAASTPVTDGEHVYVYFGSVGLVSYDFEGAEQWRHALPTVESFGGFGSGASPVLADGLIILNRDQVSGSEVVAIDARTGRQVWAAARGQSFGWCTPAIWEHDEVKEVILPASAVLKSYDLKTGAERWRVRGIAAATCSTPVIGDGLLFVSSWTSTDANNAPPPFTALLQQRDQDGDGALSLEELKGTELTAVAQTLDINQDKRITREEYEPLRLLATRSKNVLLAIKPGGQGDSTGSHVAWTQTKGLPYVSSPLFYDGRLYVVKDGGMVSCFEAQTGKPIYLQERLGAPGNYYASPIASNGRIYAASVAGVVVVFEAGDTLNVLARNDLGERISATPAIVENALYVRTAGHLFAFAPPSEDEMADAVALFDGKSLKGWKESEFSGGGKIQVHDGQIELGLGFMTGITWTNELPRMDYEIRLEAMRVEGSDFFCGLTFPVGTNACSLIVGGWGGSVVGISSLDYLDAANNETTQFIPFTNNRWYRIRVRVEPERIRSWIDNKQVVDVKTTGRKITIRSECEPSLPMGIATWSTAAALRNLELRRF